MQSSRKTAITALFVAFAVVLSYVETFIPVMGIPGVKLGLANFAVMLALYLLGYRYAIFVNLLRIIIVGAFFGNLFSISFSIVGAVVSFIFMAGCKKSGKLSIITVAVIGGVFHNIAQLIVASFVVDSYGIIIYMPVLIISGIFTGLIIGILSNIVYRRIKDDFIYFRHD